MIKNKKLKTVFTVTKPSGEVVSDTVDSGTYEVSSTWSNSGFFAARGKYHLKIQAYTGSSLTDVTDGTFVSNILEYDFRVLQEKEIGIMR